MEVRPVEEAKQNILDFATEYIVLLKEKKELDGRIKELKNAAKENGIPSSVVATAINKIKAMKKKTTSEIFEEEQIQTWIGENKELDDAIGQLAAN